MKFTRKDLLFGVVVPGLYLIIDKSTGDFKSLQMPSLQSFLSATPYLVLLYSIWYFARLLMKRLDALKTLMKDKIYAAYKISSDSDVILKDLFIEGRDIAERNTDKIIKSLNKLGDDTLYTEPESSQVVRLKTRLNEKLDEVHNPLKDFLANWD
jgi:hypothetical protein